MFFCHSTNIARALKGTIYARTICQRILFFVLSRHQIPAKIGSIKATAFINFNYETTLLMGCKNIFPFIQDFFLKMQR